MLFNLGIQGWVVGDGTEDGARVDEVEGVFPEGPGLCEVVDLELEVGRDDGGLDGREIGGYD
jgi:hypothetical protein